MARKIAAFRAGQKTPTAIDLHRELNALKKTELQWMYEVSKCAPQEALRNLDQAFDHFFRRLREQKAVKQLAQAHRRVANVRQNALHQATSRLAKTKSVVVLEDLNVNGTLVFTVPTLQLSLISGGKSCLIWLTLDK